MELLILSHFQKASEFQNFASLVDQELPVFFFFRETERIRFFDELVYSDHYDNGMASLESGIKLEGREEGFWTEWYKNGQKKYEGSYRNGRKEGFWIRWFDNEEKEFGGSYRNGKAEGRWIFWYINEVKCSEGSYRNGEKEGLWIYWEANGTKSSKVFYRNGHLIK